MNDVTAQQIRHFSQFGWIEYEEFLSPEECKKIYEHLQSTAFKRLQIRSLAQASTDRLYSAMRDCWRDQPWLKKLFLNQNFLSIAENLTGKKNLILACDQWVPEGKTFSPLILSSHLSFQNLACAAFLALEGEQIGKVRWLVPERMPLFGTSELLIAYGTLNTVYVQNSNDPSNAYLKQFGYNFGDRIVAK